ncbi:MAG: hypothetical protein ACE14S_06895 [Candidatus Bathyarchaeia archaeon]
MTLFVSDIQTPEPCTPNSKPICPECGLNVYVKKNGIANGKQRYYCDSCHRDFCLNPKKTGRRAWIDRSSYPLCPKCSLNAKVYKVGCNPQGKQRYKCYSCNLGFSFPYIEKIKTVRVPKPKMPKPKKIKVQKPKKIKIVNLKFLFKTEKPKILKQKPKLIRKKSAFPPCPKCGSREHIYKHGFNRSGKQNWQCNTCHRFFVLNPTPRNAPRVRKKLTLEHQKQIILANRKPQSFDSLIDVPCSSCDNIQGACSPETCSLLTNWLKGGE